MKLSPAIQLVMKAAANATARKALNLNLLLNPPTNGAEIKDKITIKIKKSPASSNPT
jgi:hypothetical protein